MTNEPSGSGSGRGTGLRAHLSDGGERGEARERAAVPAITVKLQLDLPGGTRLGPGKIRLLELIDEQGSLSRAAEAMSVSYRRAWLFVQHINAAFDEPAVSTPEHGHGGAAARLTDFGKELISRFRRMEARAEAEGGETLDWLMRHRK